MQILRTTFGHMEPQEVKPRHVAEFINVPTGRVHRNRMVTILSTVFKKAMGRWCLDLDLTNPCTVVERWPTKPRTRYVTDDEFTRFRAMCPAQVQIAMDLALLTGQRQGDIIGLTWDQIHAIGLPREEWFIEIKQGKTGKHLGIRITPAIEAVLSRAKMMKPNYPHDWVIRTEHGYPYTEDGFPGRCGREQCAPGSKTRSRELSLLHDLRAKCISRITTAIRERIPARRARRHENGARGTYVTTIVTARKSASAFKFEGSESEVVSEGTHKIRDLRKQIRQDSED